MRDHDPVGDDPVERAGSARAARRRSPAVRIFRSGAALALAAAYSWWAVALPPFSGKATAAVLLAGGVAWALGAVRPPRRWPEVGRHAAVPWAVVAVLAGLWELAAYGQLPRDDHPTLSSLANGLLDSQPGRATAFVAWVIAMVGLSRR